LVQIDGQATNGNNATLKLKQISIINSEAADLSDNGTLGTAVIIKSNHSSQAGMGLFIASPGPSVLHNRSYGKAVYIQGASVGFNVVSTDDDAMTIETANTGSKALNVLAENGDAFVCQGGTAYHDFSAKEIGTGFSGIVQANLVQIDGQATNGNNATLKLKALDIVCNTTNQPALNIKHTGATGTGLYIQGGDDGTVGGSAGCAVILDGTPTINGGASDTAGTSLLIRSRGQASPAVQVSNTGNLGSCIYVEAGSGSNGIGMLLRGSGNGAALQLSGGMAGKDIAAKEIDGITSSMSTIDGKLDAIYILDGTISGQVDTVDNKVDSIISVLPTTGRISNLALTDEIDGSVQLLSVLRSTLAMAHGRFKKDYPSAGQVTYYRDDNTTPQVVFTVTDVERYRV
jgi:hypothetical protein